MTQDIYKQHQKAFQQVSAHVILYKGERVATIAFKSSKDGAGRLYAYVHWFGTEMVRGYANGYGYNKKSVAVESAIEQLLKRNETNGLEYNLFLDTLKDLGGNTWNHALLDAKFAVLAAV